MGKIVHVGVVGRCSIMFMGVILVNLHETISRPVRPLKGLKACVTC